MGKNRSSLDLTAWSDITTIICFLLVLIVPGLTMLVSRQHGKPEISKQAPINSVVDHYTRFNNRFQKAFGFRAALVDLHLRIKRDLMGVSPSHTVQFGKDSWLFYFDQDEVACSRHSQLSEKQLAHWAAVLEARRAFLEKRGIHYLFLVVPEKHTVYPEFLPEVMAPVNLQSALDQIIGYVAQHTKVRILDVRPALLEGKPLGSLYYRTDTHWNTLGAFIAYQQIMARLQAWYPDVKSQQLSNYSSEDRRVSGDLASIAGLENELPEAENRLVPKFKSSTRFISDAGELIDSPRFPIDRVRSENPAAPIPKLVMFRDSFSTAMLPYLAEHFRSAVFLWRSFDATVVETEKPDIVIEEMAERVIPYTPAMP